MTFPVFFVISHIMHTSDYYRQQYQHFLLCLKLHYVRSGDLEASLVEKSNCMQLKLLPFKLLLQALQGAHHILACFYSPESHCV